MQSCLEGVGVARLDLMRDILSRWHYTGKKKLVQPGPDIAFEFMPDYIDTKRLAR